MGTDSAQGAGLPGAATVTGLCFLCWVGSTGLSAGPSTGPSAGGREAAASPRRAPRPPHSSPGAHSVGSRHPAALLVSGGALLSPLVSQDQSARRGLGRGGLGPVGLVPPEDDSSARGRGRGEGPDPQIETGPVPGAPAGQGTPCRPPPPVPCVCSAHPEPAAPPLRESRLALGRQQMTFL